MSRIYFDLLPMLARTFIATMIVCDLQAILLVLLRH
jgi:hypothetical protein